jgi:hypothetical protein
MKDDISLMQLQDPDIKSAFWDVANWTHSADQKMSELPRWR